MSWFVQFLLVGLGGAIGAMLRFAVQSLALFPDSRHLLTAVVNITGCLLIGVAYAVIHQINPGRSLYLFAVAGILGGYTTYSTFTFDAFNLIRGGHVVQAVTYLTVTIVGGFLACAAGYLATEKIIKISAS